MRRIVSMLVLMIMAAASFYGGVSADAEKSRPLRKYVVRNASSRKAVCNDGTPAVFYYRPGRGKDKTKWVIFLEGGGACSSDAECIERYNSTRDLMSSANYPDQIERGGILSTSKRLNPDFSKFNHVFVQYCSSDTWLGDTERNIAGVNVQFRGHHIVKAVIEDLMDSSVIPENNLKAATEVIFSGSSAGSFGAQNNMDRVAEMLSFARVSGVLDSGWKPPIPGFGQTNEDPSQAESSGFSYWNAQPDESCLRNYPDTPNVCLYSYFVYSHISTPVFVYVDQRDENALMHKGVLPPYDDAEKAYIDNYIVECRASLSGVSAVFSPSTGNHTALTNDRFTSIKVNNHTFAETLGNWYFNRQGPIKVIFGQ